MRALLFALLALLATPVHAAFDVGDLVCETSTTTGTGTLNLAGAVSNYVTFVSQIASGNTVPYHIRASDGKLEVGIGTFTDATPDTLSRTADWSTDGSGAELTLPAGTHTVCLGPISGSITHNPMTEDLNINGFDFINTTPDTFDGSNLVAHYLDSGDYPQFVFEGTSDATGGPFISTYHNSSSPADADEIGGFSFYGETDTGALIQYANFAVVASDVSNGSTDSVFKISTRINDAFASSFEAGAGIYVGAVGGGTMPGTGNIRVGQIELGADADTTIARSAAGEATFEGDAVKHAGKQMMFIPAGSMRNSASSSASCGDTYDSGSNDLTVTVCAFDTGATEERAEFGFQMPKAWNESTVTFSAISTCAGACAEGETLQYELACAAISDTDTMNSAQGTPQSSAKTLQATPTNEALVGAESSAITIANTPAENDYVHCRISRDTSADNMAGDALLIGVRFFWTDNASTLAE